MPHIMQQPPPQQLLPPGFPLPLPNVNAGEIAVLQAKITALKEQIAQSEKNLSDQDEFLKKKKKVNS
jgi:hypothetical protein